MNSAYDYGDKWYKTSKFKPNSFPMGYSTLTSNQYPMNNTSSQYNYTAKKQSVFQGERPKVNRQEINKETINMNWQNNMLQCYIKSEQTTNYLSFLESNRINIGHYLNTNNPYNLRTDLNYRLLSKENELLSVKTVLENQLSQNKLLYTMEEEFCKKVTKRNEELIEKIRQLSNENDEMTYQRKKLQKNNAVMEQQINFTLMSIMTRPKREPEADVKLYIPPPEPIKEEIQEEEPIPEEVEESEDEEQQKRIKRYKIIKDKIVRLNMNHKPGKLDEINKRKWEEELRKEKEEIDKQAKIAKIKEKYERPMIVQSTMMVEETQNVVKPKNRHGDIEDSNVENPSEIILSTERKTKNISATFHKVQTFNNERTVPKMTIKIDDKLMMRDDLSKSTVLKDDKERILNIVIDKIENYSRELSEGTLIYQPYHANVGNFKQELKQWYYNIFDNPNAECNVEMLPMLIYEIINSNSSIALNPQKLESKTDYDENDFDIDLNEDFEKMVADVISHLIRMMKKRMANKSVVVDFLAKALLNFEYTPNMLTSLKNALNMKMEE